MALVLVGSCYGLTASAKCGSVDYTQGADALAMMHDYVVTMMLYVLYLAYAFAAIMAIISALQIYIKDEHRRRWHYQIHHDPDWSHHFMISASIVFPAFFGYQFIRELNCRRGYKTMNQLKTEKNVQESN